MVTEMPQYSALRCVSGIRQNNAKPLISNGLRFIITCLLTAALGVLFHTRRHTFAVMMLDLGTDIYTVSKLLGHREIGTTQIYARVLDKNKQAAVAKIPSILNDGKEPDEE